jgi:hypothetical protein
MGMSGVGHEIVPGKRQVSTAPFDDYPGESLNTPELVEGNGKTIFIVTI